MNLKSIQEQLPKGYWLDNIQRIFEITANFTPTKNEFKSIIAIINGYAEKKVIGRSINWFVLALVIDQEQTVYHIIKDGIFKISRFDYNLFFPQKLYEEICINCDKLNLQENICNYFHYKYNYLSAWKDIGAKYNKIKQIIIKNKETIFKDLLAISDFFFLKNIDKKQNDDPTKIDFYSKEEVVESISFILFTLFNTININPDCINKMNENNIINNKYLELIIFSCYLKKYTEWEVKIDSFGYKCIKDSKSIHITDSDLFLEKSIQHGWIYTFIQKSNYFIKTINYYKDEALSLEEFCDKTYDIIGDTILKRKKEPVERLVLEIPYYPPLFDMLKRDQFFLEEISILSDECREMFKDPNELLDFEVEEGLSFRHILYVHRLFNFFRYVFSKYLESHIADEPEIVLRSLLPVYRKDVLLQILATVIGEDKAEIYLNLFTWNNKKNVLFDLQYRPMININQHYIVPINAMCKSDVFRNTLYIVRKRMYDNSNIDPIAEILKKHIFNKKYPVDINVEYNNSGFHGDIDLIAKFENTILIVEAKNTLLPGNIFELRTTYDNLLKAASQLSKIKCAISTPSFANYLSKKIGWEINADQQICTCIVLANRLFSGYRIEGHAVRSIFELAHFINEGTVLYQDGNTFQLWEGNEFQGKDLENYIVNDNFHKLEYELMKETVIKYPFSKFTYDVHTYVANYEHFAEKLKSTFKYSKTT